MIRAELARALSDAVEAIVSAGQLPAADYPIEISEPKNPAHGDFASSFALTAAKFAGKSPAAIASLVVEQLSKLNWIESASAAGPGFVNIRLSENYFCECARNAFAAGSGIARTSKPQPMRVNIEFVSVNPNGPIHVGHGRGAAFGDTLARLLEASGDQVWREFYVNDGVNSLQMRLFAESVKARYRELLGLPFQFPDDGYKGDYVMEVAERFLKEFGDSHADDGLEFWQPHAQSMMLEIQKRDLERFGVKFDCWFSEQSLHDDGSVSRDIDALRAKGELYEQDGALYLRSTAFGDDKDRVVVRADGRPTYIASDIAYHKNKFDRGFDHLIDVWGADHHGYVQRTRAAVRALGYSEDRFEAIITQLVRFYENGKLVEMSKRDGSMVTLAELMDQVGPDVARFFYLMRSHEAHMEFDLDLAREHSERNPVYYVQYAHARICSLMARAKEQGLEADPDAIEHLETPERELIKKIWDLPFEVARAANDRAVHRVATYITDLAKQYHDFYEKCRVISPENPSRSAARLALCEITRTAIREGLNLLGVSAPQQM